MNRVSNYFLFFLSADSFAASSSSLLICKDVLIKSLFSLFLSVSLSLSLLIMVVELREEVVLAGFFGFLIFLPCFVEFQFQLEYQR